MMSEVDAPPASFTAADVSIAIPTYGRHEVLVDTILSCLRQCEPAGEVVVVDQTPRHPPATAATLRRLQAEGMIVWLRRSPPSQPAALNDALRRAGKRLVLFLDDDIEPMDGFVAAHAAAHASHPDAWAVVGQILQPGEIATALDVRPRGVGLQADLDFRFNCDARTWVANVMSGNMSVKREHALAVGGFDENFTGVVAYRFDTEFGRRLMAGGGKLLFEPAASIRHLRAPRGGTRSEGNHLTSASPIHGAGDYYFAFRAGSTREALRHIVRRSIREVSTRFHLRHPWYIPVKLLGEVRAIYYAARAASRGPRLIEHLCDESRADAPSSARSS